MSDDRSSVNYLCSLIGTPIIRRDWNNSETANERGHPHICYLEAYDATFLSLFHFGVTPRSPSSIFPGHVAPGEAWEAVERIALVKQMMDLRGLTPDLIMAHSNYWIPKEKKNSASPAQTSANGCSASAHPSSPPCATPGPEPISSGAFAAPENDGVPNFATRMLDQAAFVAMRAEHIEVLNWAETVVGRWDLRSTKDDTHQNERSLTVYLRMILEKMERDFGIRR
ncbi:hypothetical protein BDK51DRAFT_49204 [Blyttiomyces helicus]|uniref:Uncharacterized protein n=1 Tax=Blyttiomyces helicus TaxID=388810 RepID=A0A4P9WMV9_9FUNG|nr:hypothetical protein BDK51DRAFT_49204 [Blyttiomyces helicus]|eukprot:RKO93832.1 hypothetical protein BDK51DRAFT_49204 [Blyttiomyces helicus]